MRIVFSGTASSGKASSGRFRRVLRPVLAAALIGALSVPAMAASEEDPAAFTMFGDLVVARPVGIAITAVGAVAFVIALPFSALGGNVKESADALVTGPFNETFRRCLGCSMSGYKQRDPE